MALQADCRKSGSNLSIPLLTIVLALVCSPAAFSQKPEIVVQKGFSNYINSAAYSPDGRILASAQSYSKIINLWQVDTGRELRTLAGHTEEVKCVSFSPDGKTLASGSNDKTVKLWDIASGEPLRQFDVHPLRITAVVFSPDGRTLAAAGYDNQKQSGYDKSNKSSGGTIKLWDVSTGKELPAPAGDAQVCNTLVFSSDGKTLISGGEDQLIKLWEVASGKELRALKGHSELINAIAISPDGKMLASGGGVAMNGKDYAIRLWNLQTGQLLYTLAGHSQQVSSVAFSPDGKLLASASDFNTILWDCVTGKKIRQFPEESNACRWVAFSPDRHTLAVASNAPKITLYNLATEKVIRELTGHSGIVSSVAFSPRGKTLISGSLFTRLKIWNAPSGMDCLTSKEDSLCFALSPDAKTLVDNVAGKIVRRGIDTGIQTGTFAEVSIPFDQITFSPNSSILAGTSRFGGKNPQEKVYTIKLWDAASGRELRTLTGRNFIAFHIAFSPDGKTLAGGGLSDNQLGNNNLKLWDVASGRELRTLTGHQGRCDAVAFSPDGKLLASGAIDNLIKLWDPKTGNEMRTLTGHSDWITALAFTPDGKLLVSASDDGTIRLWDPETGNEIRALRGHLDKVKAIDISPDGKFLASGSQDATTRLWDISSGQELASLIALAQDDWLVLTPDGLFDGSPAAWNQILWRFARNTFDVVPVEAYFNEFYYPGLLADILTGKKLGAARNIQQLDRRQPELKLLLSSDQPLPENGTEARNIGVKIEIREAIADKDHPSGSGARDVRLFRNGSLVSVWRGDVLKGGSKIILETTVSIVAGENRLTAYAFNHDNIKSADAALVVKGADALRREGIAYVIAVGVNQYANKEFDLKYAVPDAQDFGTEFQHAQSTLGRFAKTEVIILLNEAATKKNLLRALNRLAGKETTPLTAGDPLEKIQRAQPEDAVVVYFSGHGTAQQSRFYLIPHDLGYTGGRDELGKDEKAMQALYDHSLSDVEFEQAFEKIDAGELLLVIDACHSGQALESEEKRRGPMNSRGLAQLAYEKGMYILTASQSYQVAVGSKQLGHGYLTYALVEEGLKTSKADQSPADGQVLIREWLDYATQRVPAMQNDETKEIRDLVQPEKIASKKADPGQSERPGEVQRPRVFYRREVEAQPLVIVRP